MPCFSFWSFSATAPSGCFGLSLHASHKEDPWNATSNLRRDVRSRASWFCVFAPAGVSLPVSPVKMPQNKNKNKNRRCAQAGACDDIAGETMQPRFNRLQHSLRCSRTPHASKTHNILTPKSA
eukprot:280187-Rhodomonas_salina.3